MPPCLPFPDAAPAGPLTADMGRHRRRGSAAHDSTHCLARGSDQPGTAAQASVGPGAGAGAGAGASAGRGWVLRG